MKPFVYAINNQSVTDSKMVALAYGESHSRIFRIIKNHLLKLSSIKDENYYTIMYDEHVKKNGNVIKTPYFLMNLKGFYYLNWVIASKENLEFYRDILHDFGIQENIIYEKYYKYLKINSENLLKYAKYVKSKEWIGDEQKRINVFMSILNS